MIVGERVSIMLWTQGESVMFACLVGSTGHINNKHMGIWNKGTFSSFVGEWGAGEHLRERDTHREETKNGNANV